MSIFFFVALIIGIGVGYLMGVTLETKWSKWEDLGTIYNSVEYQYSMLQVRKNDKGGKQYRRIAIDKYGNLPAEIVDRLNVDVNGKTKLQTNEPELYSEIEDLIIRWSNDGTKTAGSLTRKIMVAIEKKLS